MPAPPARPRATYRLQLNKSFRFQDALRVVPYLAGLGVSHVYLSPILMARPGSMHGYDIVDHNRLNPEIGSLEDFDALVEALHAHGMGVILDFVPNHMFVGAENGWWMDILEWGKSSPFAAWVDIDWEPLEPTNAGKVVLPVLGDHYGAVLERGELALRLDPATGTFNIHYFDNRFPVSPRDYPALLQRAASASPDIAARLDRIVSEWSDALRLRGSLPRRRARRGRILALKAALAGLAGRDEAMASALADTAAGFNGQVDRPATFDALHRLLDRQSYRLAFWRVAAHEINYRRFFDINELAGLRMEQPDLFETSHRLVGRLIADSKVQGLRLDHIDGMRSPKRYFQDLQVLAGGARRSRRRGGAFYVLVEKILGPGEALRADWPVAGTTGYKFMTGVNGLFVDPEGEASMTACYARFIGRQLAYRDVLADSKRLIMRLALASELNVLASAFNRLAKRSRHTRDYTMSGFRAALEDVVTCFPVYRTYVSVRGVNDEDRRIIGGAIHAARGLARAPDTTIYDFIGEVLTLDLLKSGRGAYSRQAVTDAALSFQQYTGPVMAKAAEDTAFYRYLRLVSLNEVGGDPDRFATEPDDFHAAAEARHAAHPFSMLATATHDHKRGEDVRARLNVLSEMPEAWGRRVEKWAELNAPKRTSVRGSEAISRNDEYLLYQTVVGAWPFEIVAPAFDGMTAFRERIAGYMLKAVREAKLYTSWAAPDEAYEGAMGEFVDAVLDPEASRAFLEDVTAFVNRIGPAGAINGLAQTAIKLTAPGVPDIYQGTELWDLSLVDPDNRRAVDYGARQQRLHAGPGFSARPGAGWQDGTVKQYLIGRILELRRADPRLFGEGAYTPLHASGPAARNVVAFARHDGGRASVTVVPRLAAARCSGEPVLRTQGWEGTRLSLAGVPSAGAEAIRDILSGGDIAVAPDGSLALDEVFAGFPVAILHRDASA